MPPSDLAGLRFATEAPLAFTLKLFATFSRCALANEADRVDRLDVLRRRRAELLTAAY